MIRRTLLSIPTFSGAVPERVLESAATLSHLLGASLAAELPQLNSDPATWHVVIGAFPLDFPNLMNELVVKSEANAAASAHSLTQLCSEFGVVLDMRRSVTTPYASHSRLVDLARVHDLVILPVPEVDAFGPSCVQAVIFGSGRPVVLLPSHGKPLQWLDRIIVAWDWSREAARALSDALPLLALAREVHVVTVFGEKHIETSSVPADLEQFLAAHSAKYSLHQVELDGKSIGDVLMDYADGVNADLLVMGAYGHGRLREFVLGGATREILRDPKLPVFLVH
jgi:nucleotide-binding universal stress UspA family protein